MPLIESVLKGTFRGVKKAIADVSNTINDEIKAEERKKRKAFDDAFAQLQEDVITKRHKQQYKNSLTTMFDAWNKAGKTFDADRVASKLADYLNQMK